MAQNEQNLDDILDEEFNSESESSIVPAYLLQTKSSTTTSGATHIDVKGYPVATKTVQSVSAYPVAPFKSNFGTPFMKSESAKGAPSATTDNNSNKNNTNQPNFKSKKQVHEVEVAKKQQDAKVPSKAESTKTSTSTPTVAASTNVISPLARQWKDVLTRAGLSIEFAWRFGLVLANAGYNESNAETLGHEELAGLGIENLEYQQAILKTIQDIAAELQAEAQQTADIAANLANKKHAFATWRSLLIRAKLGKEWGAATTSRYAALLAKHGWDETNVDELTEDDLERAGVSNPSHREVILQLVEREIAEAMANPGYQVTKDVLVTDEELEYLRQTKSEIQERLEAFDAFQTRLSQILNGDTESQRQARAKREADRAIRKAEREQRKLEKTLKRNT